MSFLTLGLSAEIVRAVSERGYEEPTPIQAQAIPAVMTGGDLLGGAQTGTGKTAGFVLPILHRLMQTPTAKASPQHIRVLILTPTRELAAQVEESVKLYGKYLPLKSMVMFGGVNIKGQLRDLRSGVDILVATPGRLLDHVQQKTLDLSHIEILVLDEADRMLDMGFIRDIKRIMALVPKKRQTLLFSATFSNEIKALADSLLNKPVTIEVARRNAANTLITQKAYAVDRERKRDLLIKLIKDNDWHQVLVFTRTKHSANRLSETLEKAGIASMAIHGNKSQSARTTALQTFKDGSLRVLVATDIAARGIDISELPHVVNYELPNVAEDYVHRIGRTGRAGNEGEATSLVCIDELKLWAGIEKLIKTSIPTQVFPGFEVDPSIAAKPLVNGGTQGNRGQGGRNAPAANKPAGAPRGPATGRPNAGGKPSSPSRAPASAHRSGGRNR